MKSQMRYSPLLLLALSLACGEASKSNQDITEATSLQPSSNNAQLVKTVSEVNVIAEVSPEIARATTTTLADTTSSSPATTSAVTGQPAGGTQPASAAVPARTTSTEGLPVAGIRPLAASTPTGILSIDTLCAKSFQAYAALAANDFTKFKASNLTPALQAACLKNIAGETAKVLTELEKTNIKFIFPINESQSLSFTGESWPTTYEEIPDYTGDGLQDLPLIVNIISNQIPSLFSGQNSNSLPQAEQDARYVNTSIAILKAKATLTATEKSNLNLLESMKGPRDAKVAEIKSRISNLAKLSTLLQNSVFVVFADDALRSPESFFEADPAAPAVTEVPSQPQPPSA